MTKKQLVKRVKLGVVVADTKRDTDAMQKVFHLSLTELEAVLAKKTAYTDMTRIAATTLGNYKGIKSAEIHEMGLKIMLARGILMRG